MIKWITRFIVVVTLLFLLTLSTGFGYEQWSRYRASQIQPPGKLINVNGKLSHLYCTGTGSPTVILEAGLNEGGALTWEGARPAIDQLTRVCAYDQAGIMWSERREQPRDANHIAKDLHDLLIAANESPPYIMVGHSAGGPMIRVFTQQFSNDVAGLVLVDSSHPEQNQRFPKEILEATPFAPSLLIRTISAFGLLRLESPDPPKELPTQIGETIRAYLPQSMTGITDEIEALDSTFAQAGHTGPFGDIPIVVLTAGRFADELPWQLDSKTLANFRATWSKLWPELQAELTQLSTNTDQRIISNSSHNIPLEAPDAIAQAVNDVVNAQRLGTVLRHTDKT